MSKLENNPAWDEWEEFEREHMTPEEIAEMKLHVALMWALCEARDKGKITVEELQEIEDIYEPSIWLETVVKRLISLGMTLKVVPIEQVGAEQDSTEQAIVEPARVEQNKAS